MLMPKPTTEAAKLFKLTDVIKVHNIHDKKINNRFVLVKNIGIDNEDIYIPLYIIKATGKTLDAAKLAFQSKLEDGCASVLLANAIDHGEYKHNYNSKDSFIYIRVAGCNIALNNTDDIDRLILMCNNYNEYGNPLEGNFYKEEYVVEAEVGICSAKSKEKLHILA